MQRNGQIVIQGDEIEDGEQDSGEEMNIQGGEQNIMAEQMYGQEVDDDVVDNGEEYQNQDQGEELDDEEEQQVFQPQYQLEDIQEDDQGENIEAQQQMLLNMAAQNQLTPE